MGEPGSCRRKDEPQGIYLFQKLDHLRICLDERIESGSTGFDDIRLVHEALPDCDMDGWN
jgi:isopentenyl diphosphate isomerase/L-lactate dehydrogenase-like FMN-dependent dehydrogenase